MAFCILWGFRCLVGNCMGEETGWVGGNCVAARPLQCEAWKRGTMSAEGVVEGGGMGGWVLMGGVREPILAAWFF